MVSSIKKKVSILMADLINVNLASLHDLLDASPFASHSSERERWLGHFSYFFCFSTSLVSVLLLDNVSRCAGVLLAFSLEGIGL